MELFFDFFDFNSEVNKMINQKALNIFDELYDRTYNEISKYVVCKCNNIDDVCDILQNIYLDVYRKICDNYTISNSYVFGIAKNKIKDYYRFKYKYKFISLFSSKENLSLIETLPSDIDIEKSVFMKYDSDMVWNYLKNKKVIISKVFYLYFKLNLTIKDISEELNISQSNVKHYLYRTLKELNTYLEKKGDGYV